MGAISFRLALNTAKSKAEPVRATDTRPERAEKLACGGSFDMLGRVDQEPHCCFYAAEFVMFSW